MPPGQSAILCSGYIWQPNDGRYNVLDDGLRQAIVSGCGTGGLTTIAGKFYPSYYEDYYRNFIQDLRASGVPVTPFYAPKKNWHAKVAIRMAAHRPIAALVGSSNLTGPAYGENRNWNFEADVLIWSGSQVAHSALSAAKIDQAFGIIDVILNPEVQQPDEDSQLKSIYEDVMSSELEKFE
jgi:hypothetical protein